MTLKNIKKSRIQLGSTYFTANVGKVSEIMPNESKVIPFGKMKKC